MDDDASDYVTFEADGPIARITFNRPDRLNAITLSRSRVLNAAIRRFDEDPDLRVAVISGEGRSFHAGRDMKEQADSGDSPTKGVDEDISNYGIPPTEKIIVTSARGHAVGVGGYLLMAGDIRIGSRTLKYRLPEVETAVLGPYWLSVAELLPPAVAFRVAVLGDLLTPDELLQYGLVTAIVEDDELETETQRWVDRLLSLPPRHVQETKRLMKKSGYQYSPAVFEAEQKVRAELDALADTREAALAFSEKRSPKFLGM